MSNTRDANNGAATCTAPGHPSSLQGFSVGIVLLSRQLFM